jgi:hypothetical protein
LKSRLCQRSARCILGPQKFITGNITEHFECGLVEEPNGDESHGMRRGGDFALQEEIFRGAAHASLIAQQEDENLFPL